MRWIGERRSRREEVAARSRDDGEATPPSQDPPTPPTPTIERVEAPTVLDVEPEGETPPSTSTSIEVAPRPFRMAPQVAHVAPSPYAMRPRQPRLIPESTPPESFEQELLTLVKTINRLRASGDYEMDTDLEDDIIRYQDDALIMLLSQMKDYSFEDAEKYLKANRRRLGDERYVKWGYGEIGHLWFSRQRSFVEDKVDDWGYATELAALLQYMGQDFERYIVTRATSDEVDEGTAKPRMLQLGAMMWKNNKNNGATLVAIDASRKLEGGVTGVGKSSLSVYLASQLFLFHHTLKPPIEVDFHLANHIVYGNDYERFLYLHEKLNVRYQPLMVDEAQWFFDKRRSQSEKTRRAGLRFMTNRFYNQYWFLCGPSIFFYDERFTFGQVQFRYHIVKKPDYDSPKPKMLVEVYGWNGKMDEDEDEWGELLNKFWVPMLPMPLYRAYERVKILIGEFGSYKEAKRRSDEFTEHIAYLDRWLAASKASFVRMKRLGLEGLLRESASRVDASSRRDEGANLNKPSTALPEPSTTEVR